MDKVAGQLNKHVFRTIGSKGKPISIETNNLAKLADGACTCTLGDTSVLVTAVSEQPSKPTISSFVPLTVSYKQKAAAAGRIPMTHLRRDIGFTETEILTSRIIDRSIRTGFAKGYYLDTQIMCNLLAVDGVHESDVLAINGASASLAISDIPWTGPIGAVRMGLDGDKPIVNPTRKELQNSRVNLLLSANERGNVIMMDGSCKEPVLIPDMQNIIRSAVKECRTVIETIVKLRKACGKPKRTLDISHMATQEHKDFVAKCIGSKLESVLTNYEYDKISRDQAFRQVQSELYTIMSDKFPELSPSTVSDAYTATLKKTYAKMLLSGSLRCDGRQVNESRPITCSVDLYKPLHGSALFQRGQTQVFCSTTFDSPDAAFKTDSVSLITSGIKEKNFMLHYEFPKFATKEVGRLTSAPDRREIGHGALAEKALRPLIPENSNMTIRLNCEVLESNGSSSMASVCAGSMSLMDAGVEIKEPVAGVAMGLILDTNTDKGITEDDDSVSNQKDQNYSDDSCLGHNLVLTDISGFEDYIGDMDFKIAGTKEAITAIQLDVKPLHGIPTTVVYDAIQKAHIARNHIINIMDDAIKTPRQNKKDSHPVIKTIDVPIHKRSKFFGLGGSNIKKLTAQIGVRLISHSQPTIESDIPNNNSDPSESFVLFAPNQTAMNEAEEFIERILEKDLREPVLEFNAIYTAKIHEIRPNGVMVTLYPNMVPTLLPLSQLDIKTVRHPSALNLKIHQELQVKYFGRDPATGQMRLSRKSLLMSANPQIHRLHPNE